MTSVHTFQSTLPRRERRYWAYSCSSSWHFNPRSRAGSDVKLQADIVDNFKFQSTLPRRERRTALQTALAPVMISIHAPAQGATRDTAAMGHLPEDFNPRSRAGSDPYHDGQCTAAIISIHAPAQGATLGPPRCVPRNLISIHAPAQGATCEN